MKPVNSHEEFPNGRQPSTVDPFVAGGNDGVFGPEASAGQESAPDGITTQTSRCEIGGHQYYFEASTADKEPEPSQDQAPDGAEGRRENEDAHFIDEENLVVGVFDGLGGHEGSAAAAKDAAHYCDADLLMLPGVQEPHEAEAFLGQSLMGAHQRIAAANSAANKNMGATGVLFKILTDPEGRRYAAFAHAGDSRVYRFRQGELLALSCDHNTIRQLTGSREQAMEWQLLLANATCEEDLVRGDPNETRALQILFRNRGSVSSSLGQGQPEIETGTTDVQTGDVFVVMTDGCSDNLTTSNDANPLVPSMRGILARGGTSRDLVRAAREVSRRRGLFRSKRDDIKVVTLTAA